MLYSPLGFIYITPEKQINMVKFIQITSNIGKWTSAIFNNLKYLRSISKDFLAKKESNYIFHNLQIHMKKQW